MRQAGRGCQSSSQAGSNGREWAEDGRAHTVAVEEDRIKLGERVGELLGRLQVRPR
jgi:hypothetical protein